MGLPVVSAAQQLWTIATPGAGVEDNLSRDDQLAVAQPSIEAKHQRAKGSHRSSQGVLQREWREAHG